jgi:beta-lactamase class A
MFAKRDILRGLTGAAFAALAPRSLAFAAGAPFDSEGFAQAIRAAEATGAGRLGVALLDSETGKRFASRGNERFPVTSTFKFLAAASVLSRVDRGSEQLDRRIPIEPSDLVEYAPVTGKHVGGGLTVAELCDAAVVLSDNPAGNLLLATMGGPAGLTNFARTLGDDQFRLDRLETALNEATPGDPRDTTTPLSMLGNMERLLLGDALKPASRTQLIDWLIACRTGNQKIRAGLPKDWRCGDKTGGGGYGSNNDIAIMWPPGRRPVLVAAYVTETTAPLDARNAALAAVGQAIASAIG